MTRVPKMGDGASTTEGAGGPGLDNPTSKSPAPESPRHTTGTRTHKRFDRQDAVVLVCIVLANIVGIVFGYVMGAN